MSEDDRFRLRRRALLAGAALLPLGTRADDVLAVAVDADAERATVTIVRDAEATRRARDAARAAQERLRRRDPGGDLAL